ncbi:MAG TPA: hypothetical protein VGI10_29650 [Polyangiaceae bacterium]
MDGDEEQARDLTSLIRGARRGLRRDVGALIAGIDAGELYIPLAREIAGVKDGETIPIEGELRIVPHMLLDDQERHHAVLFSQPELFGPLEHRLGWQTDGAPLKFCTVPARFALEMALELVDDVDVHGLVLNPGSDSELGLLRDELASIAEGRALPLVGYVGALAPGEDEQTLVAEGGELSPEFNSALKACLDELPQVRSFKLSRTFNPERDREPHPTLELCTNAPEEELAPIAERVMAAILAFLPAPGYIDVVFDRSDADA